MRVLGIDPGYERLGVAVIEGERGKEKYVHSECFRTDPKLPFEERLLLLGERVRSTIKKYRPDILAIENLFIERNQKTAMRVSETRGAVIFIAKEAGLRIAEYTPLQIKSAIVGNGHAEKKQVEIMVQKLLKVPAKKTPDDEYDAIAVALTASASFRG